MKKMKTICMVLTNNLDHDSRVLNEAQCLSNSFKVKILVGDNLKTTLKNIPFEIKTVNFKPARFFPLEMWRNIRALNRALNKEKPDFIHAHDLDGLMASYAVAGRKKIPLIYDSHELFYDLPDFSNIRGFHYLIRWIEKYLVCKITAGITVNESIANFLKDLYHLDFLVLRNLTDFKKSVSARLSLRKMFGSKKIILHIGGTGKLRGTEQIIESAKYLPANYVIVFLGAKKNDPVLNNIKKFQLENKVYLLPSVPVKELIGVAKEADLGLTLTLNASLDYYYSLPNKIFQYLSAGLPILGSNFPEFKKIILNHHIGEVVDPSRPKQIARKIIKIIENDKIYRQNLKKIQNEYTWTKESKKLINFYNNLEKNVTKQKNCRSGAIS